MLSLALLTLWHSVLIVHTVDSLNKKALLRMSTIMQQMLDVTIAF